MWRRGGRLGNGGSVRRMRHDGVGLGGAALETDRETNLDGSREEGLMDRKNRDEKRRGDKTAGEEGREEEGRPSIVFWRESISRPAKAPGRTSLARPGATLFRVAHQPKYKYRLISPTAFATAPN